MKNNKSYYKRKCDALFSKIIRARGKCEETCTGASLQCAHIISRSYLATRWDYDNALCLNVKRHMFYTHHPVEWELFLIEKIGQKKLEELRRRALNYRKMSINDYKELYERLKTDWSACQNK